MKKTTLILIILTTLFFSSLFLPSSLNAQTELILEEIETELEPEDTETELELEETETELESETEESVIDENTKSTTNRYFDLTLERKPQTPFGNNVPYILIVTPHLDSPKTQIIWNTPTTLEANPKHSEFVALESGQTYTFEGKIKPLRAGSYDFSISVISWQHDTNYTNSIKDSLVFDSNLVLQPVSSHYQTLNILRFVLIGLVFIGLVVLTVVIVKKYTKKAKKWLTPPDW